MTVDASHYISRFLAKNWESKPGTLHYFSFETGRIHKSSAKSVFVSPSPFPADIEGLLGRHVETPLGEYLARSRKRGRGLIQDATPSEDAAIVLALMLQSVRTKFAQGDEDFESAGQILRDGEERVRQFAQGSRTSFEFLGASLVEDRMFFPSVGTVSLPVDGQHGWLLPLSPETFIACLPKAAFVPPAALAHETDLLPIPLGPRVNALNELLTKPGLMTAISLGIVGDKVLIPPRDDRPAGDLISWIKDTRDIAQRFNALVLRRNNLLWPGGRLQKP